jgi:hypothetical protein
MTKIAGSGFISQRHGSADPDPDPHQNVIDPQHCTIENSKKIFPGKELRGFSPNSYIHVSVSDLNIPLIGLPILLQENRWT